MSDVAKQWLVVEGVSKTFHAAGGLMNRRGRPVAALREVGLTLGPGEKLGVVGESGSGKTTLGRIIVGLVTPDAGRVLLDGADVHRVTGEARRRVRRRVQMIFQDNAGALDPRLRIGAAIAEPLKVHGLGENDAARRALVAAWLEKVGLDRSLLNRRPHELSGGQRQRVGIARALIVSPDLLVADEPVASLDVSIQTQILRLLADLVRETRVALVFISHDLRVVRALTERVLVLYRGRPVEMGPTETVIARPRHPYTQSLIASIPALHPEVRRILMRDGSAPEAEAPDRFPSVGDWREVEPGHWIVAAD
ncbi:MAG: ABC transporter ATP-binding protein [Myxococcales bacterium]|nr:ABC transporter ATP-binding protein [Myxococcales bacterium]